jgi:murein DD-endopeptidase MepM/ murein hydrolase activator NlpD
MNIIIVGRPGTAPRTIRLDAGRPVLVMACGVALALLLIVGLGIAIGATVAGPALARAELAEARARLGEQSRQLAEAQQQVRRDMDALALRLGQLQAESTRLNALGQRLARIGKLEDGEFDFSEPPAIGGPERPTLLGSPRREAVGTALDELASTLSRQGEQLRMLETVLFDREVERTLEPAGIPVRVGYLSSGFGRRTDPFTGRPEFHSGVDFAGPRGSEVLAVAGGVVSFAGTKPGYGRVVEIDHGNGYMTRYAHNERNKVDVGDPVRPGDVIATMGNSGRASGVHVHFEVWRNGRLVNPSEYLAAIR